ncbi:ubiquitin thioesterase otubain-like [Scaptodrosophila lebanonensis]|uniref:ubiquitinyl hydrolase 1 n=1 Tax=Drosophila lebanonensis TaxID=7225 RepID=A0A6J2TRM2_DROLE|nr:ubiquitin thioesterase otubain-like [Scaptodrosophila lebanonensis]
MDSKYEEFLKQQQNIAREVCDSTPLVSERQALICLKTEYMGDEVFIAKIEGLLKKYKYIRRTRPDGNCFFRAFAYSYLEYLITNQAAYHEFRKLAESSKDRLAELGFQRFTLEDFHETFMDVITRLNPTSPGEKEPGQLQSELHRIMNEQGYSDYVVVYLRLIVSGKLQEDAEFYQNFIEGNYTIEEFCHQEVEPMYKESDHIHIIALCKALRVGVRVEYLDRGGSSTANTHDFPEGLDPMVYLIYKPGHYDILYPK